MGQAYAPPVSSRSSAFALWAMSGVAEGLDAGESEDSRGRQHAFVADRRCRLRGELPCMGARSQGRAGAYYLAGRDDLAHVPDVRGARKAGIGSEEGPDDVGERGALEPLGDLGTLEEARLGEGRGDLRLGKSLLEVRREVLVCFVEGRDAGLLHAKLEELAEGPVRQIVGEALGEAYFASRARHQRGAPRDVAKPLVDLAGLCDARGAAEVEGLGPVLHDVRRPSARIRDRVVYARFGNHVLAEIVRPDVHELHGVEGASPQVGRAGGVSRLAEEAEIGGKVREGPDLHDAVGVGGVPGQGEVDALERAGSRHEGLAGAALLAGAAEVLDRAARAAGAQVLLRCYRGAQGAYAQQVVPAAVAVPAGDQLLFHITRRGLAQAGQGVVLAEQRHDGASGAVARLEGRADAGDPRVELEALRLERGAKRLGRRPLLESGLGEAPDPVAQLDERIPFRVDVPDHELSHAHTAHPPRRMGARD